MSSQSEELMQAAADLVEQSAMFRESILSADEPIQWYFEKVAELRKYLDRAAAELPSFRPTQS